jgi:uncharacterized membrane protein
MAVSLALDFATKAPCLATHGGSLPGYCYTDLQELFVARHLGLHVFPYVHGSYTRGTAGNVFLTRGEIEYPVLIGLFTWLTALPVRTSDAFLLVNIAVLTPCGLLAAWLLAKMSGWRALVFALAPGVLLYGFINWDLLSVAVAVFGVYLWWREKPYLAAGAFAVGGCIKLWPALLLVPLLADLLARQERRQALWAGLIAGAIGIGVNGPFMVANPSGWYAPFAFQASLIDRGTGTSVWDWVGWGLSTNLVDVMALSCGVAVTGIVTAVAWRRARREGVFPFLQSAAATVLLFIVISKDNSPQYVLWVLPFVALVDVSPRLVLALYAVSASMEVNFVPVGVPHFVFFLIGFAQAGVFVLAAADALGGRPILLRDVSDSVPVGRGGRLRAV